MTSRDVALHWTVRGLAGACLTLFVSSLLLLNFPTFIGAIWSGAMAYILIRVDVEAHRPPTDVSDVRVDDTAEPRSDADGQAVYSLQAAGIPLTYETRSRRARKRR